MMQIKFFDYNPYNETPIVAPHKLYTKTASFLAIKQMANSFVPLSLGDMAIQNAVHHSKEADKGGVVQIYLQNDAQNLDSWNIDQDPDEYDDQIFNPLPHKDLINSGTVNDVHTPTLTHRVSSRSNKNKKRLKLKKMAKYNGISPLQSPSPNYTRNTNQHLPVLSQEAIPSMSPSPRFSGTTGGDSSARHAQINRRPLMSTDNSSDLFPHSLSMSSLQLFASMKETDTKRSLTREMSRDQHDYIMAQRMFSGDGMAMDMIQKHQLIEEEDDDDGDQQRDKAQIKELYSGADLVISNIDDGVDYDDGSKSLLNSQPLIVIPPHSMSKGMEAAQDPRRLEEAANDPTNDPHDYSAGMGGGIGMSAMTTLKGGDTFNPFRENTSYHTASDTESEHFLPLHLRKESNHGIAGGIDENKEEAVHKEAERRYTVHPFLTQWSEHSRFEAINKRNKRFAQIYPQPHQYCGFLFPSYSAMWTTFVSPAILPLTNDTDFKEPMAVPEQKENKQNPFKSGVPVQSQNKEEIWQIPTRDLNLFQDTLDEMIVQRLTQDFQIMKVPRLKAEVVGRSNGGRLGGRLTGRLTGRISGRMSRIEEQSMTMKSTSDSAAEDDEIDDFDTNFRTHVLNTQTYIHKLSYIMGDANINITRYVDNRLLEQENLVVMQNENKMGKEGDGNRVQPAFKMPYSYNLWNDHSERFENCSVELAEQHQLYGWQKLDNVVYGGGDAIESLKARLITFALIPNLQQMDSNGNGNGFYGKDSKESNERMSHFMHWFGAMTDIKFVSKESFSRRTEIEFVSKEASHYDPRTWTVNDEKKSTDDLNEINNDRKKIGFDQVHANKRQRRLKIDLTTEWEGRHTFLILKYDSKYDPNIVFHFEIYWLIATGHQITKFVDDVKKSAKKYGLNLMQVPSAQPQKISDPFSKTLTISSQKEKRYPMTNMNAMKHIKWALISRFGFLLDTHTENTAELQFIHCEGLAIIRWHANPPSFTWVSNNLRNRIQDAERHKMARKKSIQLFKDFRRYFHDTIDRYLHIHEMLHNVINQVALGRAHR